ncbi:MAG: Dabb family protein [Caldilineaceae bacterium]
MNRALQSLRHVVLFKFKEHTPASAIQTIEAGFRGLGHELDIVRSFEWGINNSPEGLNQGFTHCFILTFASEADRNSYLPHPAHQQFVQLLQPHLEKALVVDFWANE